MMAAFSEQPGTHYHEAGVEFVRNQTMSQTEDTDARARNTDQDWKRTLSPDQYRVLREEGTERPFSSALNREKGKGAYVCAGCGQPLFTSDMKFDSGTGWPSFYKCIPGALDTKLDRKLFTTRTEYHCKRCGGHQGHVFEDGPRPTGQRWCNNGVALLFVPDPQG